MRLLMVGTSLGARGTEAHLVALARGLRGLGHDVSALAHPDGAIAEELGRAGIPIEAGFFRNAAAPAGWASLVRAMRCRRPDWLVGSFGHEYWPVALGGRLFGAKVALFRHLPSPLNPLSRRILPRLAHRFIAVSEHLRQDLIAQGIPAARVQLLLNPIDLARFRPPADRTVLRQRFGFSGQHVVIGFVGPLNAAKGGLTLADALGQAMCCDDRIRALWAVPEPEHPKLLDRIQADLRPRHIVVPWSREVETLYGAMDALAVPSEWKEPFGRVSIEAQACGTPVLASRIGGLPETLAPEAGWLIEPARVDAWADALVAFAARPEDARRQMGAAGARSVSRYGLRSVAEEFVRLTAYDASCEAG